MQTIWKCELDPNKGFIIDIPRVHTILSVAVQKGKPVLWAMVDPRTDIIEKTVKVIGTGWRLTEGEFLGRFVGTFLLESDGLVFHVFAGVEDVLS